jgi:hypothetical protein
MRRRRAAGAKDVASVDDKGNDQPQGPKCPRCQAPYTPSDRFCRSCGLELRDDSQAIETYLAKVVPGRIDDALKARLKDQKVVEIETAEKLAERAMSWLKTLAYFIGIPALVFGTLLSFLGIKTYSDFDKASQKAEKFEKTVSGAEKQFGGVQKRVDVLGDSLKTTEAKFAEQLAQLAAQQQNLQTQVKGIQDRLRFCPSKNLSSQLRSSLETQLGGFIKYLEKIGFQNLDDQVTVCVYSKDDPIEGSAAADNGPNAYFTLHNHTIYIHQSLSLTPGVVLREYTHYALAKVVPAIWTSSIAHATEIESGLADYIPSSFLGNAKVGEKLGPIFGFKTSYLRDLDNDLKYSKVESELHHRGEVWGGAFWRCRAQLGRDVVDPVLVKAWLDLAPEIAASGAAKKFAAAVATSERAATGKPDSCMAQQVKERGLPQ